MSKFLGFVGLYGKEIQAFVVTVLLSISAAMVDGYLDVTERWTAVGVALAGALAMSFIANATSGPFKYAKAIIGALLAGVGTLIPLLPGGLSTYEWLAILSAMIGLGSTTAFIANARYSESRGVNPYEARHSRSSDPKSDAAWHGGYPPDGQGPGTGG